MRFVLALLALTVPLSAHEFHELVVSRASHNEAVGLITVQVSGTTKGDHIVCAARSNDGLVLASRATFGDNLGTVVMIPAKGVKPDDIAGVQCVYNE